MMYVNDLIDEKLVCGFSLTQILPSVYDEVYKTTSYYDFFIID